MAQTVHPLVTIPGTIASHVLGTSVTELGSGDLTLVATDIGDVASPAANTTILTLTVGNAAFSLYAATKFGTVAGDERIYVFQPALGDDIKGCVTFFELMVILN